MKKHWKKVLFIAINIAVFIALLFIPYVRVVGETKNAVESLFSGTLEWISIFVYFPFILYILGIICFFLHPKLKGLSILSLVLFLLAGFLFIFSRSFIAFQSGLDEELVTIDAGSIIFAVLSFLYALVSNGYVFDENKFSVRDIVESAMLVAFAVVLDLQIFKFKIVANGGSISLAMLPLFIVALRQGPVKGFIVAGIVYGFINCLMDGYGFVYFPFDYLLGFGSIAIAGLFRHSIFPISKIGYSVKGVVFIVIALLLAGIGRTLASTLSGILFYQFSFLDSLIYQLMYIPASIGLCLVALLVLYIPLQIINKRYPLNTSL